MKGYIVFSLMITTYTCICYKSKINNIFNKYIYNINNKLSNNTKLTDNTILTNNNKLSNDNKLSNTKLSKNNLIKKTVNQNCLCNNCL